MPAGKLTRAQVAQLLGVTTKTLYTWEKAGRIPAPERDWRGWRWYTPDHVAALRRIVTQAAPELPETSDADRPGATPPPPETAPTASPRASFLPALDISARNRLIGTITHISGEGVLAEVVLDRGGGNEIVSVITRASVERLGLAVGTRAVALIKATEVLLAREA